MGIPFHYKYTFPICCTITMSNDLSASVLEKSASAVPTSSQTSKESLPWGPELHHLGISIPQGKSYSGALVLLPGFSAEVAKFPAVMVEKLEFVACAEGTSCAFKAALTAEGASVAKTSVGSHKQSARFSPNDRTKGEEAHFVFEFGDMVASQVKPISSTAVAPAIHFWADGADDLGLVLHVYFRTAGPMNVTTVFQ